MIVIKNSKELAKLVNKDKDLLLQEDNVRIEFEPSKEELRDVYCRNLFLMDNSNVKFDFKGGDFNGWSFTGQDFCGGDFNGYDFTGRDFNGGNFNGGNFNGRDFNGGNFNGESFDGRYISYYAWFITYGDIKCELIKGRRENSFHKSLDGKIIIKEEKNVKAQILGEDIFSNGL